MKHPSRNHVNCLDFKRNLYHFQARQLSEAEHRDLERHAEDCPPCGERLAIEDSFLRGLQGRLTRASAPPGLRERVHESLRKDAIPASLASWLRVPWLVPLTAALVLALVLIPVGPSWTALGGVVHVVRDVTVVDHVCDRAGLALSQQRLCPLSDHLNALKLPTGKYWLISANQEASRKLVVDRDMRGHRLLVEGNLHTRIRTLELESFMDRGMQSLSARLFH